MTTKLKCPICPKGCMLKPGDPGDCRVRENRDGQIRCTTYAAPCALNRDPIEKKPLYHVLPASSILSIATAGCNLHCKQCQNWQISQTAQLPAQTKWEPEQIAQLALEKNCPSIAYTYTEPLVSYEYTYDCCKAAAAVGLKNVLVTAAYINPEPLEKICRYVDAANVDLKAFSDAFYRDICGAHLQPVLDALVTMKNCGVFLEITNLIIPTLNDSEDETRRLCDWVLHHLGPQTPLHFSRFYPQHQLKHLPPTPADTLLRAREIALEAGLEYVYLGNLSADEGENTDCPACGTRLLTRRGFHVLENHLLQGCCPNCNAPIPGIWN